VSLYPLSSSQLQCLAEYSKTIPGSLCNHQAEFPAKPGAIKRRPGCIDSHSIGAVIYSEVNDAERIVEAHGDSHPWVFLDCRDLVHYLGQQEKTKMTNATKTNKLNFIHEELRWLPLMLRT
jgi:hypothetical protein